MSIYHCNFNIGVSVEIGALKSILKDALLLCNGFVRQQKLSKSSLQILKIMLSAENELTNTDRNEFRSYFRVYFVIGSMAS